MLYELRGLKKIFNGRPVLDLPELEIAPGKIYTLIGPNGAGKSTLLNLLAFIDKPSTGRLSFTGEEVIYANKRLVELRRRVVLLDQYPILFTGPVWKNVAYGLKIRNIPVAKRKKKVAEMLDMVGMQNFSNADAQKLSGGETKRVALARALAVDPEVLLCDEPGANVDKENQEIILSILDHINKKNKTSIIFSTHYLAQGRSLADETLMLERGKLTDIANENIYRAQITAREDGQCICSLHGGLLLRVEETKIPATAQHIKIYIDPEQVTTVQQKRPEDINVFSGHVLQLNQDRGRIRLGLDIGVKLHYFEPMAQYLKKPPAIGSKIHISVPDAAIRYSPL